MVRVTSSIAERFQTNSSIDMPMRELQRWRIFEGAGSVLGRWRVEVTVEKLADIAALIRGDAVSHGGKKQAG